MAFKMFSLELKECSRAGTHLRCRGASSSFRHSTLDSWTFSGALFLCKIGNWFLVLDFLSSAAIPGLVLFSLLYLGFRVWRLSRKLEELQGIVALFQKASADRRRSGFGFNGLVCVSCGSTIQPCKCCQCGRAHGSKEPAVERICSPKWGDRNCLGRKEEKALLDEFKDEENDEDDKEEERSDGDEIMKLRKELEKEMRLRARAVGDLEKERSAAASAAEEATAKMLRLQNEKAFVEREARLYHEIAEVKNAYDRHYIEQLQWLVDRLETEKEELKGRFE